MPEPNTTLAHLQASLAELESVTPPAVAPGCPTDIGDAAMQSRERRDLERFDADQSRKRAALLAAIKRHKDGTYGVCCDCEEPIAPARLAALPTARLCVPCKEDAEQAR